MSLGRVNPGYVAFLRVMGCPCPDGPLKREVLPPVSRGDSKWRHRFRLAAATCIAVVVFWSGMVSMLGGCGRGKGGSTCPRGQDTSERRDAPPCEARP